MEVLAVETKFKDMLQKQPRFNKMLRRISNINALRMTWRKMG